MESLLIRVKQPLQRGHVVQMGVRWQQGHVREGFTMMDSQQ